MGKSGVPHSASHKVGTVLLGETLDWPGSLRIQLFMCLRLYCAAVQMIELAMKPAPFFLQILGRELLATLPGLRHKDPLFLYVATIIS